MNRTSIAERLKNFKKREFPPTKYFHSSPDKLSYISDADDCLHSQKISRSILCLPLYEDLAEEEIVKVSDIVNQTVYHL